MKFTTSQLKFKKGNKKLKAQTVRVNYANRISKRKQYSIDEIEDEMNYWRKDLKNKKRDGFMSVSVRVRGKWFSTPLSYAFNNSINLTLHSFEYFDKYFKQHDPDNPFRNEELKKVDAFSIFIHRREQTGKASENGDCFLSAIRALGNKTFIDCSKGVTFERAIQLQDTLKANLYISGEFTYIPPNPNPNYANYYLILNNGHWSINPKHPTPYNITKMRREHPLCVYERTEHGFNICNDKGLSTVETLPKNYSNYPNNIKDISDLQEAYNILNKDYQQVIEETNGKINPLKTWGTTATLSNYINLQLNKATYHCDDIEPYELPYIEHSRGGFVFCKEGTYKKLYYHDVRGAFPSFFVNNTFMIPNKKGVLKTIKYLENLEYGIYNVEIQEGHEYFPYNRKHDNLYTHIDIQMAKELGLKITLLDKQALIFESLIPAKTVFGNMVEQLLNWKQHTQTEFLKTLPSAIWGVLCRNNIKYSDNSDEIEDTDIPINYIADDDENTIAITKNINQPFVFNWARLKPFLLSSQRFNMYEVVFKKYYNQIVYCKIDGVYSTKKIPHFDNTKVGFMSYKGQATNITIKNCNNITNSKNEKISKKDWRK